MPSAIRVGQGFDVHPFSIDPGRPLVLGGVVVREGSGLAGHSDADVVSHALADALLGAAGLGDIGTHFPADTTTWEGASSIGILERVVEMTASSGLETMNADCTVVCDSPRLAPHLDKMSSILSEVVSAPVSVKAKRAEGLGSIGRVEGIACLAVALLCSPDLLQTFINRSGQG